MTVMETMDDDPIRKRMDPEAQKAYDLMFSKHYILTAIIFGYVVGNLLIFAGGGYLLDSYLDTKPIFMIIGLLLSFVATAAMLYRKLIKMTQS
jgi:F0F1-type ATP synthase assembly protein I